MISKLESGRTRRPYPDSLRRLADALDLRGTARAEFLGSADRPPDRAVVSSDQGRAECEGGHADGGVVPMQLPASVPAFVGRRAELAVLSRMLDRSGEAGVVTVIGGAAGVGKTALAVHWAHEVAAEFPDGQLFVNLRGFDPSQAPVVASDAVRVFLDALQVPADRVPATVEARLGMYRSLMAGKRMLVVLDNARDAAQVRPLLPGCRTCRVVVTSRTQLMGLAAVEAARPLVLDVLTIGEARDLLRHRIGGDRVTADPSAVAQIITSCAYLPLALCIIAARAAMHPGLSLAQVAADVTARQGLEAFTDDGDPAADVRAAFSWSYSELHADAARAFRLAGLHPGPDLDRYAVAALTGTTAQCAAHLLDVLARVHLIQPARPGRYGMHDLLRGYARELAGAEEGRDGQQAALTGLFDYYLHHAVAAVTAAYPAERHRLPRVPGETPGLAGTNEAALAWLAAERPSLVAVAVHAAGHGWPSHATQLSTTLFRYLDTSGYYPEAFAVHSNAYRAARHTGDQAAEANALNSLGVMALRQGRYQQAFEHFVQTLPLYRQARDRTGEARVLSNLGLAGFLQGHGSQAADHLDQSLGIFRDIGDRVGEARTLASLGFLDLRQGRYELAADRLGQSVSLCRDGGDLGGEARALGLLGEAELHQECYQQATRHVEQALALFREIADRISETDSLTTLAMIDLRQGRHEQAASRLRHALELCGETGDLSSQASALNGLGEMFLRTAHPADARAQYVAALHVATQACEAYEQARAHDGLASTYQASVPAKARHHWREALIHYTNLGAPEARQMQAMLAQPASAKPNR